MNAIGNPARPPFEILSGEDSPTRAQQLEHVLQQRGDRVAAAADGRLALEAARRRKPMLIAQRIVQRHGGRIRAGGEVGMGGCILFQPAQSRPVSSFQFYDGVIYGI